MLFTMSIKSEFPLRILSMREIKFCVMEPSFKRENSSKAVLCNRDLARAGSCMPASSTMIR